MTEVHPPTGSVRPVPEGIADDGFDQLLEVGRLRGYLTQDDLILVLQSVELTHEVIEDVVAHVRAEGIEYVDKERDTAAPVALVEAVAEAVVEAFPRGPGGRARSPGGPDARPRRRSPARSTRPRPSETGRARRARHLHPRAGRRGHGPPDAPRPAGGRVASYSSSDHGGGAGGRPRPHLPQGDRQGPAAHRRARGRAGQADRGGQRRRRGARTPRGRDGAASSAARRARAPAHRWCAGASRPRRR